MIKKIGREEYRRMLDEGRKFRDWSLYEPMHNPKDVFYCVDMGAAVLCKKEIG